MRKREAWDTKTNLHKASKKFTRVAWLCQSFYNWIAEVQTWLGKVDIFHNHQRQFPPHMIQQHLQKHTEATGLPSLFSCKEASLSLSLDEKVPKVSSGDTSLHSVMVRRPWCQYKNHSCKVPPTPTKREQGNMDPQLHTWPEGLDGSSKVMACWSISSQDANQSSSSLVSASSTLSNGALKTSTNSWAASVACSSSSSLCATSQQDQIDRSRQTQIASEGSFPINPDKPNTSMKKSKTFTLKNHENVDTTKQAGNETTMLQKMHHLLQKEMNQTGFWNCTRAEKNASSEAEKKEKEKKKLVDLLMGELIREAASTWQQRSAASCNRSQSETAMTRNCDHAILIPLLLSASCKPWTLILIAPPRRKQSAKTNYKAESWGATTVAKRSETFSFATVERFHLVTKLL